MLHDSCAGRAACPNCGAAATARLPCRVADALCPRCAETVAAYRQVPHLRQQMDDYLALPVGARGVLYGDAKIPDPAAKKGGDPCG